MKDLLPYFEAELSQLRRAAQDFAADYPRLAGHLMLNGDAAEDPHVERLIQSFALLASRVHKRLDDDFPLFTESFHDVLYPHYLRPFPSCSIAQFDIGSTAGQMAAITTIERGTQLGSKAVQGVECKFRTAYRVPLAPLALRSAEYRHTPRAPQGTRLPADGTSVISLQLQRLSPQVRWSAMGDAVRVYLDGEASLTSLLREVLCHRIAGLMVQTSSHGAWAGPYAQRPRLVGFGEDEALIDYDERSHPAYRLLTEYFAFPDKFNFIDIPLPKELLATLDKVAAPGDGAPITLHFVLAGMLTADEARLLETISARNFGLHCTPVVNLFRQNADPIRVTHTSTQYPVVVNARQAFGYEVYSIDKVFRVQQTPHGESIDEFRPFFSLHHDDLVEAESSGAGATAGRYWHAHHDETVAAISPGYELELSIVDAGFNPADPQTDTLSLQVSATNRDLPTLLKVRNPGGDLFIEGGSTVDAIRLLRQPTPSHRFDRGRAALWRLISHLSLNHLSLSGQGVEALREMLRLYDLPRDAANRRQIDGLTAIAFSPATAWLPGEPFPTLVRGTEVRVTVEEDNYIGTGLRLFAAVLDHFFGLYVHLNSFVQLSIVSARTQQVLFQCHPRNGDKPLV